MKHNAVKRLRMMQADKKREYTQFSSVDVQVDGLRIRLYAYDKPFCGLHVYDIKGKSIYLHPEETTFLSISLPEAGAYLMACTVGDIVETCRISVSATKTLQSNNSFYAPSVF